MAENIVEVNHLTKKFGPPAGGLTAVDDISFSIKEGEIVGLLGPNGAGKTTTIYMLLGILTPTSGQILYFGKNFMQNRQEIMHNVNFASSYIALHWKLSVFSNLDVIARLYNVENRKGRIEGLLSKFEIYNLRNKRFGDLSAGEKTRVFLAKAFLNYPKVLLLDEPTASLDPDIAAKVRTLLIKEKKEYKTSMLFTSHNMAEVEEVCDRVIFIDHGKIIAEDTPKGLSQKVKLSKVRFLFVENQEVALKICKQNHWKTTLDGDFCLIEVLESNISLLLKLFADNGVRYSEITIDKPTLEDYFLEVINNEKQ